MERHFLLFQADRCSSFDALYMSLSLSMIAAVLVRTGQEETLSGALIQLILSLIGRDATNFGNVYGIKEEMCRDGHTIDLPCLVGVFLQTSAATHTHLLQSRQANDHSILRISKIDRQFNAIVAQLCHSARNACDWHTAHTSDAYVFSGTAFFNQISASLFASRSCRSARLQERVHSCATRMKAYMDAIPFPELSFSLSLHYSCHHLSPSGHRHTLFWYGVTDI